MNPEIHTSKDVSTKKRLATIHRKKLKQNLKDQKKCSPVLDSAQYEIFQKGINEEKQIIKDLVVEIRNLKKHKIVLSSLGDFHYCVECGKVKGKDF